MNEKEIQEFIDKVKGKKIKWYNWKENQYIIPTGEIAAKYYNMTTFKAYKDGLLVAYPIKNGLNVNNWIMLDEKPEVKSEISNNICTCDSLDLFRYGCKCQRK